MNVSLCMYPELAVTWCAGRNLKLLRNQDVRFCSSASRAVTQEPLLFQQDLPPSWSMEDCFGRFDDSSAVWVWRLQWRKWESRRHQETFFFLGLSWQTFLWDICGRLLKTTRIDSHSAAFVGTARMGQDGFLDAFLCDLVAWYSQLARFRSKLRRDYWPFEITSVILYHRLGDLTIPIHWWTHTHIFAAPVPFCPKKTFSTQ